MRRDSRLWRTSAWNVASCPQPASACRRADDGAAADCPDRLAGGGRLPRSQRAGSPRPAAAPRARWRRWSTAPAAAGRPPPVARARAWLLASSRRRTLACGETSRQRPRGAARRARSHIRAGRERSRPGSRLAGGRRRPGRPAALWPAVLETSPADRVPSASACTPGWPMRSSASVGAATARGADGLLERALQLG